MYELTQWCSEKWVYNVCMYAVVKALNECFVLTSQCITPFVGNGVVCGRDSDSDGYADMKLDCDDPQCAQVICVIKKLLTDIVNTFLYVTRSDKTSLIAQNHTCSLNIVYLLLHMS